VNHRNLSRVLCRESLSGQEVLKVFNVAGGQKYASGTDPIAYNNLCQIFRLTRYSSVAKISNLIDGSYSSRAHFRVLTLIELNALSYMRH
jgi:hypothetical protein